MRDPRYKHENQSIIMRDKKMRRIWKYLTKVGKILSNVTSISIDETQTNIYKHEK